MFAVSPAGVTILLVGEDLSPTEVGFYDRTAAFGETTGVAYNSVYDEVAFSVKSLDALTKGRVYVVPDFGEWLT